MAFTRHTLIGKTPAGGTRSCFLVEPGSVRAACAQHGLSTDWAGSPNSYRSNTGGAPSMGHAFVLYRDLKLLDLDSYEHSLSFTEYTDNNRLRDGITATGLTIVHAEAICGSHQYEDNTPFLLHLYDKRWYGRLTSVDARYNLAFDPNSSDYVTYASSQDSAGDPWTWDEMLEDIWDNYLPSAVFGTWPGLPITPDADDIPVNVSLNGVNAWDSINDLLLHLGCGVRLSLDGTFSILDLTGTDLAQSIAINALRTTRAHDLSLPIYGSRYRSPEKVKVIFPKHEWFFGDHTYTDEVTPGDHHLNEPTYTVSENTGLSKAISGTAIPMRCSVPARYTDLGVIVNNTQLNTIASRAATQVADYLSNDSPIEDVFVGYHSGLQAGIDGDVAWYDCGSGPFTKVYQRSLLFPEGMDLTTLENVGAVTGLIYPRRSEYNTPNDPRSRVCYGIVDSYSSMSAGEDFTISVSYFTTAAGLITYVDTTKNIQAYDWFLIKPPVGARVRCEYNYQMHEWVITNIEPAAKSYAGMSAYGSPGVTASPSSFTAVNFNSGSTGNLMDEYGSSANAGWTQLTTDLKGVYNIHYDFNRLAIGSGTNVQVYLRVYNVTDGATLADGSAEALFPSNATQYHRDIAVSFLEEVDASKVLELQWYSASNPVSAYGCRFWLELSRQT